MIKGLMILADGFEQVEALATSDIIERSHEISIDLVSLSETKEAISSHKTRLLLSKSISEIDSEEYDFLVLPGGKIGMENLKNSAKVQQIVLSFHKNNKLISAICASPSIFGHLGLLKGKKYTCFPGFESSEGEYINASVIKDGKMITGHSMAYSIEFGLEIVDYFLGKEAVKRIRNGIEGN